MGAGALAAAVAACARRRGEVELGCPVQPAGFTAVSLRLGRAVGDSPQGLGTLVVVLTSGTADAAPIRVASVTLHADTTLQDRSTAIRSTQTGADGVVRWDSLPVGHYGVSVRRIGYAWLRQSVVVRDGYADTLNVRLRQDPACLMESNAT